MFAKDDIYPESVPKLTTYFLHIYDQGLGRELHLMPLNA